MNVPQLIQTLVATVVGGLIVIATNWLSTRVKRREAVQEWYEKTYVTEGIDPVMVYLLNLSLYFYNKTMGGFVRVKDIDNVPVEAVSRLYILFRDGIVFEIISACHALLNETERDINYQALELSNDACQLFMSFRVELLGVIATKVRTKRYNVDTIQTVLKLRKVRDKLAKMIK